MVVGGRVFLFCLFCGGFSKVCGIWSSGVWFLFLGFFYWVGDLGL